MLPIYNLNVAKRGQVETIDKNSSENRRWYNGFDVGFTARTRGASLYGGVTAGKQTTVFCEVDDPNSLRFCDQRDLDMPYLTQFKLAGTYPLPYGMHLSGSWQGLPGVPVGTARQDAEYVAAQNRVPDASLNVEYIVTPDADSDPHGGEHHGAAHQAGRRSSSTAGTRSTFVCRRT